MNDNFICSIGNINYNDYPTYILSHGLEYAKERRRLYRIRHAKEGFKIGTPSFYAMKILW